MEPVTLTILGTLTLLELTRLAIVDRRRKRRNSGETIKGKGRKARAEIQKETRRYEQDSIRLLEK